MSEGVDFKEPSGGRQSDRIILACSHVWATFTRLRLFVWKAFENDETAAQIERRFHVKHPNLLRSGYSAGCTTTRRPSPVPSELDAAPETD